MNPISKILPLLFFVFSLSSCYITDGARTLTVEIMKPGIFTIPKDLDTLAIVRRDLFQSDTCLFKYYSGYKTVIDSSIKNGELANICTTELSHYLENEGYFRKVYNYGDSLNSLWNNKEILPEGKEKIPSLKGDVYLFLDYFNLGESPARYDNYRNTFAVDPKLVWTLSFKNDTLSYLHKQVDELTYEKYQFPAYIKYNKVELNEVLKNSSQYLAKSFYKKFLPSWVTVDRMYYKSQNPKMIVAQKYALNNNWIKAAEIWNKETKNKNEIIAAKACYNMALACEMEGKYDLAIDWLVKSYGILSTGNEEHKLSCKVYIDVLALRKKEVERLGQQVRNLNKN